MQIPLCDNLCTVVSFNMFGMCRVILKGRSSYVAFIVCYMDVVLPHTHDNLEVSLNQEEILNDDQSRPQLLHE